MLVASLPIAFQTGKPPGLQLNCKAFQIQRATLSTKGALGNITKVTFLSTGITISCKANT